MSAPAPTIRRQLRSAARLIAWAAISMLIVPVSQAQTSSLPELGDAAESAMSPAQEKEIGRQFLRQLTRNPANISDPELLHYMNRVGGSVAAYADLRGVPIRVGLIEAAELNAFAVPGGYITFHTGLVMAADDESELAGVMAHEIAHIAQRHLPRMVAKAEASKLPTAAAVLASILVGGQVGLAGLTMANATLLSNQLAYTRDFEREADSIGIRLAQEAGYDPRGMANFFGKLERYNAGVGEKVPEFLRTHPLSYTRIAAAEDRAHAYPPQPHDSSRGFYFARAKIRALFSEDNRDDISAFRDELESDNQNERDAAAYGLALTYQQDREYQQAYDTLGLLEEAYPGEVTLEIALAELDLTTGRPEPAIERYARLTDAHPELGYLSLYEANALIAGARYEEAKRVIRYRLRRDKDLIHLYPLLAKANVELGILAEAHQANAEFHAALGEYEQAASSLRLVLRESNDGYLKQSATARLREIEEIIDRRKKS